jgi:hypothetical protein
MVLYSIEENINFYDELYKSLDDKEDKYDTSESLCLITNTKLTENFVTLDCNHTFNYNAIFNDIYNHKRKYNIMENTSLKTMEIRCPYCRKIQNKLLPYIDGFKKVHGVNYYDETLEFSNKYKHCQDYVQGQCEYLTIDSISNIAANCSNKYVKLLPVNNKYYCCYHKHFALKEFIKSKKIKEKEDKIFEKNKIKEEKKKLKLVEKNAIKVLASLNENIILSSNQNLETNIDSFSQETNICIQILKSGNKKGQKCCLKIFNENMCKRHYNLHYKVKENIKNTENINNINNNI